MATTAPQTVQFAELKPGKISPACVPLEATTRLKVHLAPAADTLEELQVNGLEVRSQTSFIEQFFDTSDHQLLKRGFWLRLRKFLGTNQESWVFQTSASTNDHLLYQEYAGSPTHLLAQIRRLLPHLASGTLQSLFPTLIASFLTVRHSIKNGMTLDVCFFDAAGQEVYAVLTTTGENLPHNALGVPSKVIHYLQVRNRGLLRSVPWQVVDSPKITRTVVQATLYAVHALSVKTPPESELRLINNREYQRAQRLREYRQRLADVKKRLVPLLLEKKENFGRWAVVFQGHEDNIKVEDSYDVACNLALDEQEPGKDYYVFHIVPHSEGDDWGEEEGILLTCPIAPDSKANNRVWVDLCVETGQATLPL